MMRIALNLLGYTSGRGGVDTYLVNLINALQALDENNEYLILCDPSTAGHFAISRPNFTVQRISIERPSPLWFVRGVLLRVSRFDLLTRVLRDLRVDVMHHPLTTLNPPGLPYPAVLTFHDMQHEFLPNFFAPQELERRRREYAASATEAQAVIAISQHVKTCLIDRYLLPPGKIHVVHHGYSDNFGVVSDPERIAAVKKKYALSHPFMIYPAATWAHKNHLRLFEALAVLVQQGTFNGELLLTGVPKDFHGQVIQGIERFGLRHVVRWLGHLPEEDLAGLYNLARLMIFPSLHEGFGFPVIEAMACGCPVAVARAAALPEVGGAAACYFDPTSVEGIAEGISHPWLDEAYRAELSRAGLCRAKEFSWEKSARETLNIYQRTFQS